MGLERYSTVPSAWRRATARREDRQKLCTLIGMPRMQYVVEGMPCGIVV